MNDRIKYALSIFRLIRSKPEMTEKEFFRLMQGIEERVASRISSKLSEERIADCMPTRSESAI